MEIEQTYTESELHDLELIFSKTWSFKKPVQIKGTKLNKAYKIIGFISSFLFLCSSILWFNMVRIVSIILLAGAVFILLILMFRLWIERKTDLAALRRKLEKSHVIVLNEDSFKYGKREFLYTDIGFVIEYKNILILRAVKRGLSGNLLIMKANEEEKSVFLSKLDANIPKEKMEEPCDLKMFFKLNISGYRTPLKSPQMTVILLIIMLLLSMGYFVYSLITTLNYYHIDYYHNRNSSDFFAEILEENESLLKISHEGKYFVYIYQQENTLRIEASAETINFRGENYTVATQGEIKSGDIEIIWSGLTDEAGSGAEDDPVLAEVKIYENGGLIFDDIINFSNEAHNMTREEP